MWEILAIEKDHDKRKMAELNTINTIIMYLKQKLKEFNGEHSEALLYLDIRGLVNVLKKYFKFELKKTQ